MKNRAKKPRAKAKPNPRRTALKADPTRTSGARRRFAAAVKRKFRLLRRLIVELVAGEDAFGLNPRQGWQPPKPENWGHVASFNKEGQPSRIVFNAFCPTGPGGGVDPSCSPGYSPKDIKVAASFVKRWSWYGVKSLPTIGAERLLKESRPKAPITLYRFEREDHDPNKSQMGTAVPLQAWSKSREVAQGIADAKNEDQPAGSKYRVIERIFRPHEVYADFGNLPSSVREALGGNDSGMGEVLVYHYRPKPTRNQLTANDRWRFRTSPEKVKEFQAWLKKQFGANLTGLDERELWRRYIEDGYKRGAGRAWDDANPKAKAKGKAARSMDFYQGTREQFLRSAFGRPETEEKVKLLVGRAFDDLEGVTEDMGRRMSRVLADGLVRGAHPNEVARALADEVDIGETRATLIARTEFLRAHNEAALDSMQSMGMEEVGVAVEWEVTEDEKLCPRCEAMRGVILKIDEARGMLPLHPNCLPGDSLVLSRSGIAAASERWFDGDVVVIRTASGRELTCTPNHPVLAGGGLWTPAHLLHVGDDVVCDGGSEWGVGRHDDDENMPARIHDVAKALGRSSKVRSREVPVSAPDFHGDGVGSKITVVWSDGQLGNRRQATFGQHLRKLVLGLGDVGVSLLANLGAVTQFLEGSLAATGGCVRCLHLGSSLGVRHPGPLDRLGLALAAQGNAGLLEPVVNAPPADAELLGKRVGALAGKVGGDDVVDGQRPVTVQGGVVGIPENPHNDLVRDAILGRQLASGQACAVFLDQVVSAERIAYSGHVYNLETGDGWYAANGIITHNCRCAWVPANVGEDNEGQKRSKGEIEAAAEEADVDLEVSGNRPRSILNAFCPTGPGGGVDPTCSPGGKGEGGSRGSGRSFSSAKEASDYVVASGIAKKANFDGLTSEQASGVVDGLEKALKVGGKDIFLREVVVAPMAEKDKHHNANYIGGRIQIDPTFVQWAEEWPSRREAALAEYRRDGGTRNYAREDARSAREAFELLAAHEAGHHIEHAGFLDLPRASREVGILSEAQVLPLSGYATMNQQERFAEAHAMVSTGRSNLVPEDVMRWYEAAIATVDPDPMFHEPRRSVSRG